MSVKSFEAEAEIVLSGLRDSIASVFENIGANRSARPVNISRLLEIDMNLAWKLANLFKTADPFACGKYIPGEGAMGIFLKAAEEKGCSRSVIDKVRKSYNSFNRLKKVHAGSRKELDMLLASLSGQDRRKSELLHRKKAYEANGYIFGVQTRTQLCTSILVPAAAGNGRLDCIRIRGHIDLKRIRPNVPWRIATSYILAENGSYKDTPRREPLFPCSPEQPPLVAGSSSTPTPEFSRKEGVGGSSHYSIVGNSVGNTSLMTLFTAEAMRNAGAYYSDGDETSITISHISRTPTENLVLDILVPAGDFSAALPEPAMYSELFSSSAPGLYEEGDRLPLTEKTIELSMLGGMDRIPEVPSYPEVINSVLERIGEEPGSFRLFRLQMKYPPVPSNILMEMRLPDSPDTSES